VFRIIGFVLFVLAALLAFISDFTTANIALDFIIGVIAAGLACVTLDPAWKPGP
jgi:ABC-type antimicrobial peptide transport system permease subunit